MAKKLKLEDTGRGFARADFDDLYDNHCSIQESSLATVNAIWLGVHEGSAQYDSQTSARMHLNQEQAAALIPLLERFVKTGRLRTRKWRRAK